MATPLVAPPRERRVLGAGELLFSTTDAAGVIDQVNSVFLRLSGYRREQLVGASHNLVRHPQMPGATFASMWRSLKEARPAFLYFRDLGSDGRPYDVFSTVVPLGERFLSVRGRPLAKNWWRLAHNLNSRVGVFEEQCRTRGWSAEDAARLGLEQLESGLAASGYPSPEQFGRSVLLAEVQARLDRGIRIGARPLADGQPAELLAATRGLERVLVDWLDRYDRLQDAAINLADYSPRLLEILEQSQAAAEGVRFDNASGRLEPAAVYLRTWAETSREVAAVLADLLDQFNDLRHSCALARAELALTVLHNMAAGQYVLEVIDEVPQAGAVGAALADLGQALADDLDELAPQATRCFTLAAELAYQLDGVTGLLELPQSLIREWLVRVAEGGAHSSAEFVDWVSDHLDRSEAGIATLGGLATSGRELAKVPDLGPVREWIALLTQARTSLG
ncbi:aerotaxis receptor [Propionicimonas paludicola]|uniref:Aerotaxis receptor n=1 Tax=Propionicimonas paludicola TaxID=185243 RepID=A0A2A9CUT1_9ACTN|nr:PAS domain S-box protein [Propionicimonas paludicola]PFG17805.1 aerotaxis receptor [Propionicimonas paludicola]